MSLLSHEVHAGNRKAKFLYMRTRLLQQKDSDEDTGTPSGKSPDVTGEWDESC